MPKQKPYQYGISPNPRNYHEASEALKSLDKATRNATRSPLTKKLDSIEKLLKDHK